MWQKYYAFAALPQVSRNVARDITALIKAETDLRQMIQLLVHGSRNDTYTYYQNGTTTSPIGQNQGSQSATSVNILYASNASVPFIVNDTDGLSGYHSQKSQYSSIPTIGPTRSSGQVLSSSNQPSTYNAYAATNHSSDGWDNVTITSPTIQTRGSSNAGIVNVLYGSNDTIASPLNYSSTATSYTPGVTGSLSQQGSSPRYASQTSAGSPYGSGSSYRTSPYNSGGQYSGTSSYGSTQYSGASPYGSGQYSGSSPYSSGQFSRASPYNSGQYSRASPYSSGQASRYSSGQYSGASPYSSGQYSGRQISAGSSGQLASSMNQSGVYGGYPSTNRSSVSWKNVTTSSPIIQNQGSSSQIGMNVLYADNDTTPIAVNSSGNLAYVSGAGGSSNYSSLASGSANYNSGQYSSGNLLLNSSGQAISNQTLGYGGYAVGNRSNYGLNSSGSYPGGSLRIPHTYSFDPRLVSFRWRWNEAQGEDLSGESITTFDSGSRCDVTRSPHAEDPSNWNTRVERVDNSRDKVIMLMKGTGGDFNNRGRCISKSQITISILRGDGSQRITVWIFDVCFYHYFITFLY